MIVLALLLLIAAAALVVFIVVTGSTGEIPLEWDAVNIAFSPSPLILFLLGALTMLLVVLALGLLRAGSKRSSEKRRELKQLRRMQDERESAPAARREVVPARGNAADHDTRGPDVTDQPREHDRAGHKQHDAPPATPPAQMPPPATGPAQTGPAHTGPAHTGPAHTGPAHTGPAQQGPAQPAPPAPAPKDPGGDTTYDPR